MATSFQLGLFETDEEAYASHCERKHEEQEEAARREARRVAWYAGEPLPEDVWAWIGAQLRSGNRKAVLAWERQQYRKRRGWRLHNAAKHRAARLGCRVGQSPPILAIYERYAADAILPCYWCLRPTRPEERQVDHVRPVARGGSHIAKNLCIACTECNGQKRDRPAAEFLREVGPRRKENKALWPVGRGEQALTRRLLRLTEQWDTYWGTLRYGHFEPTWNRGFGERDSSEGSESQVERLLELTPEEAAILITHRGTVLVGFHAPACRASLTMQPLLRRLAREWEDHLAVVRIRADHLPAASWKGRPVQAPYTELIADSTVLGQWSGPVSEQCLREAVCRVVTPS